MMPATAVAAVVAPAVAAVVAELRRPPLPVVPALRLLLSTLVARRGLGQASDDDDASTRREAVLRLTLHALAEPDPDTAVNFERVVNGCLSLGYRTEALAAFVFGVLERRLMSRIRRRLSAFGRRGEVDEAADLLSSTAETIARMLRDARRETYDLRVPLLLSIADHRVIDHLRRRRHEHVVALDEASLDARIDPGYFAEHGPRTPEAQLVAAQRSVMAHALRDAVFEAVNELPARERSALIAVELEDLGYPEIASRDSLVATDVGNIVRRARLLRDRALVPQLRTLPGLQGHVGFTQLQADKGLRLRLLRWSSEMGDGACLSCQSSMRRLHPVGRPCWHGGTSGFRETPVGKTRPVLTSAACRSRSD
ncbi:MAG: RNA polymerase sigma factor [Myxococcales bacterium]|nr:RNA polymerase sigma factor [Myxococcales bacterium]